MDIHPVPPNASVDPISPTTQKSIVHTHAEGRSSLSSLGGKRSIFTVIYDWIASVFDFLLGLFSADPSKDLLVRLHENGTMAGQELARQPKAIFNTLIDGMISNPVQMAMAIRDNDDEWRQFSRAGFDNAKCCEYADVSRNVDTRIHEIVLKKVLEFRRHFKNSPESCRIFLIGFCKSIAAQLNLQSVKSDNKETVKQLIEFLSKTLPEKIAAEDLPVRKLAKWVDRILDGMHDGTFKIEHQDICDFIQETANLYWLPIETMDIYRALSFTVFWKKGDAIDPVAIACDTIEEFLIEGGKSFAKKVVAAEKDSNTLSHLVAAKFEEICDSPPRVIRTLLGAMPAAIKAYGEEPQKKDVDLYS